MKVLILSAIFPPHVIGGAEMCAFDLAKKMAADGHDVRVMTLCEKGDKEEWNAPSGYGFSVYRLRNPRAYSLLEQTGVRVFPKILWHLQEYFDPRNRWMLRRVLNHMQPDHVQIHVLTGLGYNMLKELGRYRVPVTYVLHDLGLACVKTTMFKNGHTCKTQCPTCKYTTLLKSRFLRRVGDIAFVSPSLANMNRVKAFVDPVQQGRTAIIRNMPEDLHSLPSRVANHSAPVEILYAGRLHKSKGASVILEALAPLAAHYDFHVTIFGSGEDEPRLKSLYGTRSWVTFGGFVTSETVLRHLAKTDVMCVPSVLHENYSRSVIEALRLGTPVFGSNIGGIPEQVEDDITGLLLPPGDVAAWQAAFEKAFNDVTLLPRLAANAARKASEFDSGAILAAYIQLMKRG